MILRAGVIRNLLLVGLLSLAPKIAFVVRDLLIAAQYGMSDQLDAFVVALSVPSLIMQILGQAIAAALVPSFIQARNDQGRPEAVLLAGRAITFSMILLGAVTLVMELAGPWIIPALFSGFSPEKQSLTITYYSYLTPLVFFQGCVIICTALLNANDCFGLISVVPLITPSAVIAVSRLFPDMEHMTPLVLATVIGGGMEIGSILWMLRKHEFTIWNSQKLSQLRPLIQQAIPVAVGMCLSNANIIIDQVFASFQGSGGTSNLSYGNKVPSFMLSMAALPLSTVLFPYFSKMVISTPPEQIRRSVRMWMLALLGVFIPVTCVAMFLSPWVVEFLFQHGRFHADDTEIVTRIQIAYLAQTPGYILAMIIGRVLSALQKNTVILTVSFVSFAVNMYLDYVLSHYIGISGIAASTSFVYTLSSIILMISLDLILKKKCAGSGTVIS